MNEKQNNSGFNEELYLEIAKEMGIEVAEGPGPDEIDGKPVDIMKLIFGKTSKEQGEKENEFNNK